MEDKKVYRVKVWRKLPQKIMSEGFYSPLLLENMIALDEILVTQSDDSNRVIEILTGVSFPLYYHDFHTNKSSSALIDPQNLESITYVLTYKRDGERPILSSSSLATSQQITDYCSTCNNVNLYRRMLEYQKLANELTYVKFSGDEFQDQKFPKQKVFTSNC